MPQCRQHREGGWLPIIVAPPASPGISLIQGCPGPCQPFPERVGVPVLAAQAQPQLPVGSQAPSPGHAQQDSSRISLLSQKEATTAHAPAFDVCLICGRLIKARAPPSSRPCGCWINKSIPAQLLTAQPFALEQAWLGDPREAQGPRSTPACFGGSAHGRCHTGLVSHHPCQPELLGMTVAAASPWQPGLPPAWVRAAPSDGSWSSPDQGTTAQHCLHRAGLFLAGAPRLAWSSASGSVCALVWVRGCWLALLGHALGSSLPAQSRR